MKQRFLLTLAVLFVSLPQTSAAQASGVRLTLGAAAPTSDSMQEAWKTGGAFGVAFDIPVSDAFTVRSLFAYSRFTLDKDNLIVDGVSGGEVGVLEGMIGLVYTFGFESSFVPYIAASGGLHWVSLADVSISNSLLNLKLAVADRERAFGSKISGGVEYAFRERTHFFLEIDYTSSYIEGGSISYVATRIGVAFRSPDWF